MRGTVSIMRFVSKNMSTADIHRQICEAHGATVMCEGKTQKCVRDFKAKRDSFGYEVFINSLTD